MEQRSAKRDPRNPEKVGKYVIVKEVGRGSTGVVYLSNDPYYRRDVAIKVYNIESHDEDRARVTRKMFLSEAHMVGMLQHPNILPIFDAGEEDGRYYIVTEHVHGARTLSAYCKPDNLLPAPRATVQPVLYEITELELLRALLLERRSAPGPKPPMAA